MHGGGRSTCSVRRCSRPRWPTTIGSGIIDPPKDAAPAGDPGRGAARRDRLEPHHLELRAALVLDPVADRRPASAPASRRTPTVALVRSSGTRSSSRWWCRRCSASLGGALVILAILWAFRKAKPKPVNQGFRRLQPFAAAFISLAHGTQDAQKTMGVIALALLAGHPDEAFTVPLWVKLSRRRGDRAGHLLRRLADHPHPRPADHQDRPAARLRDRRARPPPC